MRDVCSAVDVHENVLISWKEAMILRAFKEFLLKTIFQQILNVWRMKSLQRKCSVSGATVMCRQVVGSCCGDEEGDRFRYSAGCHRIMSS
jgi:hypothetical protein